MINIVVAIAIILMIRNFSNESCFIIITSYSIEFFIKYQLNIATATKQMTIIIIDCIILLLLDCRTEGLEKGIFTKLSHMRTNEIGL